jgi:hypothetical protein
LFILFHFTHIVFIGVAEIVNRIDGLPFDEHDEQLFEVTRFIIVQYFHNAGKLQSVT